MNKRFTYTEKGAAQLASSGDKCLDLFAEAGSARNMAAEAPAALDGLFADALAQDARKALAIMFWVRAVRQGAGERDVFHRFFATAWMNFPDFIEDNLALIGELGYYKDYVRLAETFPVLEEKIAELFARGILAGKHLPAKWLPRRSRLAALVRAKLGMGNADFRRTIARLSATVEQAICRREWGTVNYAHVPSKAFNRYRKAFIKRDRQRFISFLIGGKVNTTAIYPHEVFSLYYQRPAPEIKVEDIEAVINAQWKNLPRFIDPAMRFMTVLDTSGSMTWGHNAIPNRVAYPLALYCAGQLKGPFRDKVITFSQKPSFINLSGCKGAVERMKKLEQYSIIDTTNIAAVFRLLLAAARSGSLRRDQLPNCLLVLSDMQFDEGAEYKQTLMDKLRLEYKDAGYDFPALIYWNLNGLNTGIADGKTENVSFVSGFNPKILESVFRGMKYDDTTAANETPHGAGQVSINPVNVMDDALAPLLAMLDYTRLRPLPTIVRASECNPLRGKHVRLG